MFEYFQVESKFVRFFYIVTFVDEIIVKTFVILHEFDVVNARNENYINRDENITLFFSLTFTSRSYY